MAHLFGGTQGRGLLRLRRSAEAVGGSAPAIVDATPPYVAEAAVDTAAPAEPHDDDGPPPARRPPILVDSATRTWWAPGAERTETLVEALAPRARVDDISQRVAALTAGGLPSGSGSPSRVPGTADPAFSELLLVELIRAGRWERAFAQLAPECQDAWESPGALAAAHAGMARRIAGARVAEVRALDTWTDEERETCWTGVAELVVEYALRTSDGVRPMRRIVHLVEVAGRWRSLLFPPPGAPFGGGRAPGANVQCLDAEPCAAPGPGAARTHGDRAGAPPARGGLPAQPRAHLGPSRP